jgi:aryl-alcohol dehydrogenase-like predicted oxidoreductase
MNQLERRPLGKTGLMVTTLGFGAMDVGGPPPGPVISDEDAGRVLNAVLDAGINFIDTSICYGASEARIGKAIAGRRAEYVLASKCGCVPNAGMGGAHVHTAANIRAGVEHSLKTMRTDYLDIVQIHRNLGRREWEAEGTMDELQKLKREGKVRFLGISGFLPQLAEQIDSGAFDVFQIPYSALQRENEVAMARASAAGAGIIVRGAVARGAPVNWDKHYYMLSKGQMSGRWDTAHLDDLLQGSGRIEFMLRFALASPDLDTTIVGTSNLAHLKVNVAAAQKGPLPADVVAEARRRLEAAGSRPA